MTIVGLLSGFGSVQAPDLYDSTTFANMRTALSNNLSSFKNASFYEYTLDGTSVYINDGGGDMFDGGNYTSVIENGSSVAPNFGYDSTNLTAGNIRYGGLGYARPLSAISVTTKDVSRRFGFSKTGNNGADGGGSATAFDVYTNQTVNTFTVTAWAKLVSGAGDPSICDLYATIGHTKWGSVFTSTNTKTFATYTDTGTSQFETTSTNSLMYVTLLSKSGGIAVTLADCQTVLQNVTSVLKTHFGY